MRYRRARVSGGTFFFTLVTENRRPLLRVGSRKSSTQPTTPRSPRAQMDLQPDLLRGHWLAQAARGFVCRVGQTLRARSFAQFALAPEALITFAHFSVSSAIIFPKSAGEPPIGGPPSSMNRDLILGSASAALIS